MKLEIPKGMRDFLPEDMILRQKIIDTFRKVFESYGFQPLETPALERWETLASKYAGGTEILKETYSFKDKAGRKLALRYDLTVPLARVIAMNPQLAKPFKRYQIGPVWRYFEVKRGRYREFYQADIDVIGAKSMQADAECISCAVDCLQAIGLKDFWVRISNRKILSAVIKSIGVKGKVLEVMRCIDKLDKIGLKGVRRELKKIGVSKRAIEKLMSVIKIKGAPGKVLKQVEKIVRGSKEGEDGLEELRDLISFLDAFGKGKKILIDLSLARGLDYYTSPIFEIISSDPKIGSIAGGGRYDEMIAKIAGLEKNIPATGISLGIERIVNLAKETKILPPRRSKVEIYLAPVGEEVREKAISIAQMLRKEGVNVDIDLLGRSLGRQLEYCDKLEVPWVAIVGPAEVKRGKVRLRDMRSGRQKEIKIELLAKEVKRCR
jgi:histidyl-tRNA synthetase